MLKDQLRVNLFKLKHLYLLLDQHDRQRGVCDRNRPWPDCIQGDDYWNAEQEVWKAPWYRQVGYFISYTQCHNFVSLSSFSWRKFPVLTPTENSFHTAPYIWQATLGLLAWLPTAFSDVYSMSPKDVLLPAFPWLFFPFWQLQHFTLRPSQTL